MSNTIDSQILSNRARAERASVSAAASEDVAVQAKDQSMAALADVLSTAGVDADYISYTVGEYPNSSGASEGTIGAYFKEGGFFQKIEWDGSEWQDIGESIAAKRYVDDKDSLFGIENVQALKQKSSLGGGSTVNLLGYDELGDGGGGELYWDPFSVEDDDGGTVFSVDDVLVGRWKRIHKGELHFKQFGAKGDGVTDDTAAIQAAVNSTATKLLGHPGDVYLISEQIELDHGITIDSTGEGSFKFKETSGITHMNYDPNPKLQTDVVSISDNVVGVSSVNNIEVGDLVIIVSDKLWYYDNRNSAYKGEISRVYEIEENNIVLYDTIHDSYDLEDESLVVRVYKPESFSFRNVSFEGVKNNINSKAFDLWYTVDCNMENVEFLNECSSGARFFATYNLTAKKVKVYHSNRDGHGYGMWINGNHTFISDSIFINCRGPVDFSSGQGLPPSRNGSVYFCDVDGAGLDHEGIPLAGRGMGTHGPAENIIFSNNKIRNVYSGIRIRGKGIRSMFNEFNGITARYYHASHGANFSAVGDKTVFDQKGSPIDTSTVDLPADVGQFQDTYDFESGIEIRECDLWAKDYFVLFGAGGSSEAHNVIIKNNISHLYQPNATAATHIRTRLKTLVNSTITGNDFKGDVQHYREVIIGDNTVVEGVDPDFITKFKRDGVLILDTDYDNRAFQDGRQLEIVLRFPTDEPSFYSADLMFVASRGAGTMANLDERSSHLRQLLNFGLYENQLFAYSKTDLHEFNYVGDDIVVEPAGSNNEIKIIIPHSSTSVIVHANWKVVLSVHSRRDVEFISLDVVDAP